MRNKQPKSLATLPVEARYYKIFVHSITFQDGGKVR